VTNNSRAASHSDFYYSFLGIFGLGIFILSMWLMMRVFNRSPELPIFISVIATASLTTFVDIICTAVKKTSFYYLSKREKCIHGIKGGETFNKCDCCRLAKERIQQAQELIRKSDFKKREISIKAAVLANSERLRLHNIRLRNQEYLLKLSSRDFEDEVSKLFSKLGYSVKQTPYSNDGGKDAIAFKDGEKFVFEYKRYGRDKKIGRPVLQKLFAAMNEEKAKGIFITTGLFAKTSVEYAGRYNIELVDLEKLTSLMRNVIASSPEDDIFFTNVPRVWRNFKSKDVHSRKRGTLYLWKCCPRRLGHPN
jgi:hypothetical protein